MRSLLALLVLVLLAPPVPAQGPTSPAERLAAWAGHRDLTDASPFAGMHWTAMGPRISGGRVEAIAVPPGVHGTIYVGMASGGIWKTVNQGLTWRPVFTNQSTFAIGDIAIAPSNPDVIWVGTGEAQPRHSGYAYAGTGVFRSRDGGDTWEHLGLTDTHHIGKVLVHPANPDVAWVAALGHFWTPNRERGVFRTTDGGRTWTHVLAINDSTGVVDLAMDPADPDRLYAWAWQMPAGRHSGLHVSSDGGRTWARVTAGLPAGPLGRAGLDAAPSAPGTVYVFLDNQAPDPANDRPAIGGQVYRSDTQGRHWRQVDAGDLYPVMGEFGWKFSDIRVSPENPEELFILGLRGFHSRDGGRTWTRFGEQILRLHDTPGKALHLDHHELWIDPHNPDRLLLGNDGGVFQSWDRGRSWLHLNNIPATQFYFLAAEAGPAPYRVFGGTQDNAALYGPSTARTDDATDEPWRYVYLDRWTGGDSYVTLPDPTDPRIVYYEHQHGAMRRMDLTGSSVLSGGPASVNITPRAPAGEPPYRFGWYTPFLISHHDQRTLYAGADRVLKSTTRGDDWTPISPMLGEAPGGLRAVVPYGSITMLAESPLRRGLLYAGTEGGAVWRGAEDEGRWVRVADGLPSKWVTRVVASEHVEARAYVSLSGYREDDFRAYLFASDDHGTSWRDISGNLPAAPVNVVRESPHDPDWLFVGTDLGVYVSPNRGARWYSLSANLPTAAVHDLVVQREAQDLLIGTYGLGAFRLELEPVLAGGALPATGTLAVLPPRAVRLDYHPWETLPGDRRGRPRAELHVRLPTAGPVVITIFAPDGRTVWTARRDTGAGINTLVWDLADPEGREVAAGRYRVEATAGGVRAAAPLDLLPRQP